jgi:transposase
MQLEALAEENLELQNKVQVLISATQNQALAIQSLQGTIENLEFQLKKALLARFGRKSEKLTDANKLQLDMFVDAGLDTNPEELGDPQEPITIPEHKRKKPGRKPLPADLPRVREIHDLPEDQKVCPCGYQLSKIKEIITEKLNYIPESMEIIEHIRYVYACKDGCKKHLATANLPPMPIPKGIATPSLLANIIANKYEYHLPFYRQEKRWERRGIDISRTLMINWAKECGRLVKPLIECIKSEVASGNYIQADETPCQVLKEPGKLPQTKSYIWAYRSHVTKTTKNPLILYEYQPTRGAIHPNAMLEDFSGFLQTDDFSSYDEIKRKKNIIGLACLDHCRRKFMDIIKVIKKTGKAHQAMSFINKLYKIERDIKGKPFDEIKQIRQEKANPVLEAWHAWLLKTLPTCPPKGPLGQAIGYTLGVWKYFVNYLDEGFLKISTILVENNMRPIALGRNNWLFFDTVAGAIAGCYFYTLIENAKIYKFNPEKYLNLVLQEMPKAKTLADVEKLLPYNITEKDLNKLDSQTIKPDPIDTS